MAIKQLYIWLVVSVMCVVYSHGMFFTDSKDNDYPRIGKRLPPSVYSNWLRTNQHDQNKPYTLREVILKQMTQEDLLGSSINKDNPYNSKSDSAAADRYIYDVVTRYLTLDNDGIPL